MSTLLRVLPYFKSYRWFMVAGYIAVIGNAFFNLAVPRLIGIAVDDGAAKQDVGQLV
jgi:ABC-type multidrug transport system fused ATPase/permease subunit